MADPGFDPQLNPPASSLAWVVRAGVYFIDIPDDNGNLVESILFDHNGPPADRPSLEEGTHYYAIDWNPPIPSGPAILRRTVIEGKTHDEHFSAPDGGWIDTGELLPYQSSRGDDMLKAISEYAAMYLIEHKQACWATNPW